MTSIFLKILNYEPLAVWRKRISIFYFWINSILALVSVDLGTRNICRERIFAGRMSDNPVVAGLSLVVGLIAIGAIVLAFGGFDPTIAVDIGLPIFILGVFVALGFGFVNAFRG